MSVEPRHRAARAVRRVPRVQPVPRHAGEYVPEDRTLLRLGSLAFTLEDAYGILRRDDLPRARA